MLSWFEHEKSFITAGPDSWHFIWEQKEKVIRHFRTLTVHCMQTTAFHDKINWAVRCDFQQCGILTCVDSDQPGYPPFKLRDSKLSSVSSWTVIEYSRDKQRLWSDCAYAQADLSLCWSHIPHCWKSHALAQFIFICISALDVLYRCCVYRYSSDLYWSSIILTSLQALWELLHHQNM